MSDRRAKRRSPFSFATMPATWSVAFPVTTAWGWLYVQWLWVDERRRGKRMASRMLDAAESEAADRGCHGALIDTFSPAAARAYERQGYSPFGILPDFPIGRSRIYLQKSLRQP